MPNKKVSVIIPTMKGRESMLKRLLSTIPDEFETIVVDDTDLLLAGKRNKGARLAKGEYLLFIDDDNYLNDKAIYRMVDKMAYNIGVMGMTACYHNYDKVIADGGSCRQYLTGFTKGLRTNISIFETDHCLYEVDEVANAFMIPKVLFEFVGCLDEYNFPIDLDEADICKRIKDIGYKVVMNPLAICYHESQTYNGIPDFRRPMNAYFMARNKILFQKKHLNLFSYMIYLALFLPITVCGYGVCLIYKRKPMMFLHYLKGTLDGLLGSYKNKYQS